MLVNWKIAFILGITFWLGMCIVELYFGNIYVEDLKPQIRTIEEVVEETVSIKDETLTAATPLSVLGYIFWFIFSLVLTSIIYISIKGTMLYLKRKKEKLEILSSLEKEEESYDFTTQDEQETTEPEHIKLANKSSSTTKIPRKISSPFVNAATSTNLVEIVRDFSVKTDRKDYKSKSCDRKMAKREGSIFSSKEFLAMVKKAEMLLKEKNEYTRRLQESQKEIKYLKQQLEEITGDKALLIRKLECATREIKINTTSKKMTLDKLEEAGQIIHDIKMQMDKLQHEKEIMEEKLKQSKDLNSALREKIEVAKRESEFKMSALRINKEVAESVKQSERDIEKVENKLENLERSLEKIKKTNRFAQKEYKDHEEEIREVTKAFKDFDKASDDLQEEENFICFNAEYTTDHEHCSNPKCFEHFHRPLKFSKDEPEKDLVNVANIKDSQFNLMPEKDVVDQKGNNGSVQTEDVDLGTEDSNTSDCNVKESESAESSLYSDSSIESHLSSNQASTINHEFKIDLLVNPGIVSQSPEFQQFLMKVLEGPQTPRTANLLLNANKLV